MKVVMPKVYFVGYQEINLDEVHAYLRDSGNIEFWNQLAEARKEGVSGAEILCSMFAKLCYKSLRLGANCNVTKVRDIEDNLAAILSQGHGSVLEHVNLNFLVTNCSRVFTHEMVRHRVGTAFSQTSGRYCRIQDLEMVFDPILNDAREELAEIVKVVETNVRKAEIKLGLRDLDGEVTVRDFGYKKKVTSALRRFSLNGASNEIAVSLNIRALRHTLMVRTAESAEWEIREVFGQIYQLVKNRYEYLFSDATFKDGVVSGMKLQPYEKSATMLLDEMNDDELRVYLETRPSRHT